MNEALVDKARSGDREAMEALLASVAPSIRRFAIRMCKNEADADDVLQDALLSIASHLDTFAGRSSFSSWAFVVARSACVRRRRGKKNRPAERDDVLASHPAEGLGPAEGAERRQTTEIVGEALARLADDHREVLLLRDVEGLTAPEAAVVLGISVDALKSRLHRARGALRDALAPILEGDVPPRAAACPDVVRALSQKLEDELTVDACAEMERHVETCSRCARTCDAVKDALRACRASTAPEMTPELRARIHQAIHRWLSVKR